MIRARYTEPAEFLADLERDKAEVEGNLVRLTKIARPVPDLAVTRVAVLASVIMRGRLAVLEMYVGDLAGLGTDDAVQEAADKVIRVLEEGVADMGLELRAGLYEEVD